MYLPYGYDENGTERYNVIYFLHGTNETQDSFIGDEKAKNALDNMIEVGVTAPFIMVFPTYYYDYETRSIDMEAFSTKEMRNDIMPAVESAYRTYAETADEAGFIASRDHRAFSGFSRGCYACWHQLFHSLDYAKWYMPFSANISSATEMGLDMPVEEQMQLLKDALNAHADFNGQLLHLRSLRRQTRHDVRRERRPDLLPWWPIPTISAMAQIPLRITCITAFPANSTRP